MNAQTVEGTFHVESLTLATPALRLTVPPSRVKDVQRLLWLEASGFAPPQCVHYDVEEGAFVLELDGEAASHLLDLLAIAMDDRHAETWAERQERLRSQFRFEFNQLPDANLR